MGNFLESERIIQAEFKRTSPYLTEEARADGIYKKKNRPFCLPLDHAGQNLFPPIQSPAMTYFTEGEIQWHDGLHGKPSNHLCDSQVCCVNFLFPLSEQPGYLAGLLQPCFPQIKCMLPAENDHYVAFEWIGAQNYLGEKIRGNDQRTRGKNFTSADAMVRFERKDGRIQVVLIEWKYTESYGGTSLEISKNGTDRKEIYRHLFNAPDCPLNKNLLPDFSTLFFEPFYQFMRQQFLAHEMEKAHELDADVVSLLHIAPAHNQDFKKITSPLLIPLGDSAVNIWKRLVKDPDSFSSVSTEQFFGSFIRKESSEMKDWQNYISQRYAWLLE